MTPANIRCADIELWRCWGGPACEPHIIKHVEWLNDPELMKFSEQRHYTHTFKTQMAYVRSFDHHTAHLWNVMSASEGLVGTIAAHRDRDNGTAELGLLIAKGRKGYGLKAWMGAIDWLQKDGARKIEGGCMRSNAAMVRIFEKSGFNLEGVRVGHFMLDGKPEDMVMYGRLR